MCPYCGGDCPFQVMFGKRVFKCAVWGLVVEEFADGYGEQRVCSGEEDVAAAE